MKLNILKFILLIFTLSIQIYVQLSTMHVLKLEMWKRVDDHIY